MRPPEGVFVSDAPTTQNPFAIASLVLGIIAIPCVCACYGFPFNLLAIVLGAVALFQASNDPTQGKGLAYGGIGLGVTSMLLAGLMFVFAIGSGVLLPMLEGNY